MSEESKAIEAASKTAGVLVDRVSSAIGGVLKPWQLKRVAKAEVEADTIRALGALAISDIQRRAMRRLIVEESYKQRNIEDILTASIPLLKPGAKPADIDEDWLIHFIDKAKLVSKGDAQTMWAKLLAGETNQPGTFSKRMVSIIALLDVADAQMFSTLCNFCWDIKGLMPLVLDIDKDIFKNNGVTWETLNHLSTIELISFDNLSGYILQRLPDRFWISYHGQKLELVFKEGAEHNLVTGSVLLTNTGQELAQLVDRVGIAGYFDYVATTYKEKGMVVPSLEVASESPAPTPTPTAPDSTPPSPNLSA